MKKGQPNHKMIVWIFLFVMIVGSLAVALVRVPQVDTAYADNQTVYWSSSVLNSMGNLSYYDDDPTFSYNGVTLTVVEGYANRYSYWFGRFGAFSFKFSVEDKVIKRVTIYADNFDIEGTEWTERSGYIEWTGESDDVFLGPVIEGINRIEFEIAAENPNTPEHSVHWTNSIINGMGRIYSDDSDPTFSYGGVTLTVLSGRALRDSSWYGEDGEKSFLFSSEDKVIKRIIIYADYCSVKGSEWTSSSYNAVWRGEASEVYFGDRLSRVDQIDFVLADVDPGAGTPDDPYIIYSKAKLKDFCDIVNGSNGATQNASACAVLTKNIDLQGSDLDQWSPIGTESNPYNGTFNGAGYSIGGLYINNSSDHAGLFGYIGANATVKELLVSGAVTGDSYVGGIAGRCDGTVQKCAAFVTVTGNSYVGGIVGYLVDGEVCDCYNRGAVTGEGTGNGGIGGLVGVSSGENAVVATCYNLGVVSGDEDANGIVGLCSGAMVSSCYYMIGTSVDENATELSEAAFSNAESFASWDFDDIWTMGPSGPYFSSTGILAEDLKAGYILQTGTKIFSIGRELVLVNYELTHNCGSVYVAEKDYLVSGTEDTGAQLKVYAGVCVDVHAGICTHNLIKVAHLDKTDKDKISVSAYSDDSIVENSTGVRVVFEGPGVTTTGTVVVTFTVELEQARYVDVHWYCPININYCKALITITHNDEDPIIFDFTKDHDWVGWHTDHAFCHAGLNVLTYKVVITDGISYWANPGGHVVNFMPEYISTFNEIDRCTQCGLTCAHSSTTMDYDDECHYLKCHDICYKEFASTRSAHVLDSHGDCIYCGYSRMEQDADGYYLIGNARQLAIFSKFVNVDNRTNIKGKLTADIDLNGLSFDPIGLTSREYVGEFDGQNHRICNLQLSLDRGSDVGIGFFGVIGSNENDAAYIHNLIIDGSSSVSGNSYVGGIAGYAKGSITIEYCGNEANISALDTSIKAALCGGILGGGESATIRYCYNTGTITGGTNSWNDDYSAFYYGSGGICGEIDTGEVNHCYNSGTVTMDLCPNDHNYSDDPSFRFNSFANAYTTIVVSDCYNYEALSYESFEVSQYTSLTDGSMLELLNVGAETLFIQGEMHPRFDAVVPLASSIGCEHTYTVLYYLWSDDYDSCVAVAYCANCGNLLTEEADSSSSVFSFPDDPGLLQTSYTAKFANTDLFQPIKTKNVYSIATTYNVTLHANDGTGSHCTFYYYGIGTNLPTDYIKDGNFVEGWYDNPDLTGDKVTEISATATGDKEYWAKYAEHICTLVDFDESFATCTEYGMTAGKICTECHEIREGGDPIRPLGHDYVYTARKNILTVTCLRCGDTASIAISEEDDAVVLVGIEAWQSKGLTIPEIFYLGVGTTVFAQSANIPTAEGSYQVSINVNGIKAYTLFYIGEKGYLVTEIIIGDTSTYYPDLSTAIADWSVDSTLRLLSDFEIASTITVPAGAHTLDLNGYGLKATSTGYCIIRVTSSVTLTMIDSDPTATHKYTVPDHTANGAGLAMVDDNLTGTEGTDYQTFTGGYITGINITGNGSIQGAVMNSGTFVMNGGTIIGNSGSYGGGVCLVSGGTFTMNGGTIANNTAVKRGGGIYSQNSSSFTMNNGVIRNNLSIEDSGGGLYLQESSFIMEGGTFTRNYAIGDGGAIRMYSSTCTMNGGTMSGNYACVDGGAVSLRNSTFTMNDGTISENHSSQGGGGFYVNGTFTMNGGTISENNGPTGGGGILANANGGVTINAGSIIGNIAKNGGGLLINTSLTITGGTISGNRINGYGGGIACNGTFCLSGNPVITDNAVDNVYLSSGKYITVVDTLTNTQPIGVKMEDIFGVFSDSSNSAYNAPSKFFSDRPGYEVITSDGQLEFIPDPDHYSVSGNTVTIHTSTGWEVFCDLMDGKDAGYYDDTTVMLGDDISVTKMAGSTTNRFTGIFDGNGKTMTLALVATAQEYAPICALDGATVKDLHIAGSITSSSYRFAGGLAADTYGETTIINCMSSVTINSSCSGDGTHGGFVSCNETDGLLTMTGCVFNGRFLGESTNSCGGFVGWNKATVSFTDCLFAPTENTFDNTRSATFTRYSSTSSNNFTNAYYLQNFNDGTHYIGLSKQAYSVTAGSNAAIDFGTPAATYSVSGISAYAKGIAYGGTFYAGSGEEVALTLSRIVDPDIGYHHDAFSVTLSEGKLTMPAANVVITATQAPNTYTITIDENGGDAVSDVDVTYDAEYSLPEVSRTGYTFNGWKLGEEAFLKDSTHNATYTYTENITLVAQWMANDYVITIDENGGDIVDDVEVTFDAAYDLPTVTRTGYTFNGWNLGGSAFVKGATYTYAEDITLVAQWTAIEYTITYISAVNGANGVSNSNPTTYTIESEDIVLVAPTRVGYTLTAWTGEGVTIAAGSTGNKSYEATWTAIPAVAPTIITQPTDLEQTYAKTGDISLYANADKGTSYSLSYQWYVNTTLSNEGGTPIDGADNYYYYIWRYQLAAGTTEYYYCVVTATRNDNGQTASTVSSAVTVTITKADPSYSTPKFLEATIGDTLADVTLPSGWTWDSPTTSIDTAGAHVFAATYTPSDTDNYNTVSEDLSVAVNHTTWAAEGGLGSGTESDPYQIDTREKMEFFRDIVNGSYGATQTSDAWAVLTADIDLEGSDTNQWVPIGVSSNRYAGTFDGGGHTVSGLYINNEGTSEQGLFARVRGNSDTEPGTIKNLTVQGTITTKGNAGGIAGYSSRAIFDHCVSEVTINCTANEVYVGGIVGNSNDSYFYDCINKGNVCSDDTAGGIVGDCYRGNITCCYNEGAISGYYQSGGIAGHCFRGNITRCYNEGTISGGSSGGIAGYSLTGSLIENCYNNGEISASTFGGGIVGSNNATVRYCYNYATVAGSTSGGVIGYIGSGVCEYCYYLTGTSTTGISEEEDADNVAKALEESEFSDIEHFFCGWDFDTVWTVYQGTPHLMDAYVAYYNQAGDAITYSQAKSILGVDEFMEVEIYEPTDEAYDRTGYTIDGWATSQDGAKAYDLGDNYTENVVLILYPHYAANSYTINIDENGGNAVSDVEVTFDAEYSLPEVSRTGYTFNGWKLGEEAFLKDSTHNTTYTYAEGITLVAQWTANDYVITIDENGGDAADDVDVTYDAAYDLPTVTRTGYTFNGWNLGGSAFVKGATYTYAEDITLVAQWTAIEYTITYVSAVNGANGVTNANPTTYTIESEDIVLVAPTRVGYTLTAWTGEGVTIAAGSTGNKTYEATWTANEYVITIDENGGDIVDDVNVTYDAAYDLPSVTRTGYTFCGWKCGGADFEKGSVYTYAEDITLVAQWMVIPAVAPTITTQPTDLGLIYGYTEGGFSVTVAADSGATYALSYQWYSNASLSNEGGASIMGAKSATYVIPTGKVAGITEYYYCVVTATRNDNAQTASITSSAVSVTIGQKTLIITAEVKNKTYGQADPALTYTSDGLEEGDEITGALTRVAGENVGSYVIQQGTLSAGGNYVIDYTGANLVIGKKTLTITAEAKNKTYGDTDPALTYTYEGLEEGDLITGSLSREEGENVGSYAILQGTVTAGGNYEISYTGANLVIGKKTLTITAVAKNKTYGETDPELTYIYDGLEEGDTITGALTRVAGENVGTYVISQGTLTAGDNYAIAYTGANLVIGKKTLTITAEAKNKTYGDTDPALTYTHEGLEEGDEITGTLTRVAGDNAGSYAIQQGTLSAGGNYEISYTGANLEIGQKTLTITAEAKNKTYGEADPALTYTSDGLVGNDAITGTLTRAEGEGVGPYAIQQGTLSAGGNYDIEYIGANFVIGQKTLTITAEAKNKIYGQVDPALTYISDGLVGNDTIAGALIRVAGENVGSYAIQQGTLSAGDNYAIAYTGANFVIEKKALTITAEAKNKTYGEADPALTYTYEGLKEGDEITGALTRETGENVGTYTITQGTLTAGNNYTISYTGANLEIGQKTLTITAIAKNKTYGDVDPALTYTHEGLEEGDEITGTLTRVAGENVGTYAITQGTVIAGGNYNISYTGANLTIGQKTLTITAVAKNKTYGQADPVLTYTSNGLVGNDTITGSLSREEGENVGSYAILQGTVTAGGNYEISYTGANLVIGKKTLTITAVAKNKTYGETDPELTYIYDGLEEGDEITGSLTRAEGENVGAYAITQGTLTAGDNYVIDYTGANLEIGQKALTITAEAKKKTYGDADPELTYIYDGLEEGDTITGALTRAVGENVGAYAIMQGSLTAGNNYTISYKGANFVIEKKALTITAEAKNKTYGEADPELTYIYDGLEEGDEITGALSRVAGENVGTYVISQGTLTAGDNYAIVYTGASFAISQKTLTITAVAKNKTYGDVDPALAYTANGLVGNDTITGALTREEGENVGTYAILQGSVTAGNNYTISYTGANLVIGQKPLTITAEAKNKTYGDVDPALTYMSDGLVGNDTITGALTRAAGENVGTYAISQGALSAGDNYAIVYTGANFIIGKKTLTITAEAKNKTYGDTDPTLTYTHEGLEEGDEISGSLIRAVGEDVGTYAILQGDLTAGDNYDIEYTEANFVIGKKALTITAEAKNKTYGQDDPALTYRHEGLEEGDEITGALTRAVGEDVGTYAITQGTLTAGDNYEIEYIVANLTIGQKTLTIIAVAKNKTYGEADPALTYSYEGLEADNEITGALIREEGENVGTYAILQGDLNAGDNYVISYTGAKLVIGEKTLTITAVAKSKTYGQADPELTYIYDGLEEGDEITGSLTRAEGENVGAYAITQGTLSAGGNYEISYTGANLVIGKKTLTITAEAKNKTYGATDPALTYTYDGLKEGDEITGTLTRVAGENVGSYAIQQGTLSAGGNYEISFTGANLVIGQKALTITAEAKNKTYGAADPALTYTYDGLKEGDEITGYLTRAEGENVGAYAITQGSLTAGNNYTISYTDANLTIGQKTLTITVAAKNKTYGQADPTLTYTFDGLIGNDTITGALIRAAGENVGTYAISQGTVTAGDNYVISYTGANLEINQKTLTITAEAKSKTYGQADPVLTYTSNGLVDNDVITGSLSREEGENVDTYAILQGTVTAGGNYNISYTEANLTIGPKALTITAEAKNKTYGEDDPELTCIYDGLEEGDTITGALTRATGENVGTYAITQGTVTAGGNYNISYTGANFTIEQKTLIITAVAKNKTYGQADPALTYMSDGLVGNDTIAGALIRVAGENVGSYAIQQGTLSAGGNYVIDYTGENLVIGQKTLTITAEAKNKTYGSADPTLTHTHEGLEEGDEITGALTRAVGEDVGTYAITLGTLTAGDNYDIEYIVANLTIGQKTLTIIAIAKNKTYGEADPALTYSYEGLEADDEITGSLIREEGESVGTYAILQGSVTAGNNYTISYTGANLVIGKKTLIITAEAKNKTYGQDDPALTYTFDGLVGNDTIIGALIRAAGENVGSYAIQQGTLSAGGNYEISYTGANLVIGQKTLTITAEAKNKTYGEADPTLTYTHDGLVGNDTITGALTRATGENVGTYAISQGTLSAGGNYVIDYTGANFVIGQKTLTITAEAKNKTYGSADPTLTYTSDGLVDNDVITGSLSREEGENVDTYAILQGNVTAGGNYNISYTGANFTIEQKTLIITAVAKNKTYGQADPALTFISDGLVGNDTITGTLTRAEGENVGTYAIQQGTLTAGDNYVIDYTGANLEIGQKTLTITAEAKNKIYGQVDPALTYISDGLVGNDTIAGALIRVAGENVGSYAIQQGTLSAGDNYAIAYTGANFVIEKKALTITAEAKNKTYGEADPALTYTYEGLEEGDEITGALTRAVGEDVGTYAILQGDLTAGDNYVISYTGAKLVIGKKTLTITAVAKSKTYGQADPELTYIYDGLEEGDAITGSLTRAKGESVGTYAITQGTLTAGDNYDIEYIVANLTIGQKTLTIIAVAKNKTYGDADPTLTYTYEGLEEGDEITGALTRVAGDNVGSYAIQQGTLSAGDNYDIEYTGANLVIGQKALTITAEAKNKTYGAADPALTFISDGLVGNDTITGALTRAVGENVGTYAISQGTVTAGNNYTITYSGADFTIGQKTLIITAVAKNKTYGAADPALTYTSNGLVGNDIITGTLTRIAGENVGTYAISQGTLSAGGNYVIDYTGANLVIGQKALTITAEAKNKIYGQVDPALTYISDGLVGNDTITGALTREEGENVDSYVILQGTITAGGNYNISYIGANLTIEQKTLIITAEAKNKTYGQDDPALTYEFDGLVNNDTITGALSRVAGENVGSYAIQQGTLSAGGNYEISFTGANLVIGKKPLTITAEAKNKTYGEADSALTYSSDGLVGNDAITGSLTRENGENVGTYAILQGTVTAGDNYTIVYTGADFTIEQKALTVTAVDKTIFYGEMIPTFTYTLSEEVPEEVLNELHSKIAMTSSATATVPGVYTIALSFREGSTSETALANYSVKLVSATLTVCKKCEIDGAQVDGLDPTKEYEAKITVESPDGRPNVKKCTIVVTVLDSEGESLLYEGETALTMTIPEGIDSDYFDLFMVGNEGSELFVDSADYYVTKDGKIFIHTDLPATFVFKNKKGQIFVKADDQTIHVGEEMPTYTFTVTGWTEEGDALSDETITAAIAAVSAHANYQAGETGEFEIVAEFIAQKDQYTSVTGYRVMLQEGVLYVLPKVLVDNVVEVFFDDEESAFDLNISLKVEVKSTIEEMEYGEMVANYLDKNSEIISVYSVQLFRMETVDGSMDEISEIKEGATIVLKMEIPEQLTGKSFRILHIHSAEDIEYVDESNMEIKDGYVFVKVNKLSEFAFVNQKESEGLWHVSLCFGWMALIFDCAFLIYFLIRFVLRKRNVRTGIKLIVSIFAFIVSVLNLAFSIMVILSHLCVIAMVSIVLATLIFGVSLLSLIKKRKAQ